MPGRQGFGRLYNIPILYLFFGIVVAESIRLSGRRVLFSEQRMFGFANMPAWAVCATQYNETDNCVRWRKFEADRGLDSMFVLKVKGRWVAVGELFFNVC